MPIYGGGKSIATRVPREPIVIRFRNPMDSVDAEFLAIFNDPIGRQLWLMFKAAHITDNSFNAWCLRVTKEIKEQLPISPETLYQIIVSHQRTMANLFLNHEFRYHEAFLERLAQAINDPVGAEVAYTYGS